MDSYDPQQPDSYAVHLASTGAPIASRDVHNQDGVLLVKKGFAIRADTVQRLLNHKLVQPLEISVNIADTITGQQLFDDVLAMLRANKECQAIHQTLELDNALRQQCQLYGSLPLITQKITVLYFRLKPHYHRALFCAWFSMALAVEIGEKGLPASAFIAGLVHDIGLLHIDPATLAKGEGHSEDERRALQSHTLIADLFLSYVEGLPIDVRRAVREHHEHNDGTGYPVGLFAENLNTVGRIVAMADTVWLASKNFEGRKVHSLAEVMTLAKMNAVQHSAQMLSALYRMQQKAGLTAPVVMPPERINQATDFLLNTEKSLRDQFTQVERLREALPSGSLHRSLRSVQVKIERLSLVVTSSGLLSDTLSQWLQEITAKEDHDAAAHIYDMSLMYRELQWQLAQLARTLQLLTARPPEMGAELKAAVTAVIDCLNGQGTKGWEDQEWREAARAVTGANIASM